MALVTLVGLTAFTIAFAALARYEPIIANNHLRSAQARLAAESGIERAIWALTHATEPDGIGGTGTPPNVVVSAAVAAPYDGSTFLRLGPAGGFYLTISGTGPTRRTVRSVGWSPDGVGAGRRTSSTRQASATVARLPNLAGELGCTICAAPTAILSAPLTVDARGSATSDCGGKIAVASGGDLVREDAARLLGSEAPAGDAPASLEGRDWRQRQRLSVLTGDDVDTIRSLAATRGIYLRPGSSALVDLRDVRDGLVFVDTPDGSNAVTATNRAAVRLGRGFASRSSFRGWIVVNGDVTLEGSFGDIAGIVYAANTVRTIDVTDARIRGMLIAAGIAGDAGVTLGGLDVAFDCPAARGTGVLPTGWFLHAGSYCDQAGGC